MGDSQAAPRRDDLDFDFEFDAAMAVRPAALRTIAPVAPVDFDPWIGEADGAPPSSGSRIAVAGTLERNTRVTLRNVTSGSHDSAREGAPDPCSSSTKPPPPLVGLSDPFNTIMPPRDVASITLAGGATVIPPAAPRLAATARPAATRLSLTERHSVPRVLKSAGEVSKLPIDHRAGFLLSHVDGMQTLEEILDVCAMPTNEALRLMQKLERMGVIAFE